ncbi:MAG: hypothetical protein ACLUW6_04905 [Coriobacteriaceae bacterium]
MQPARVLLLLWWSRAPVRPIDLILQSVAELIDMTRRSPACGHRGRAGADRGARFQQGHDIVFDDVTFAYDSEPCSAP